MYSLTLHNFAQLLQLHQRLENNCTVVAIGAITEYAPASASLAAVFECTCFTVHMQNVAFNLLARLLM